MPRGAALLLGLLAPLAAHAQPVTVLFIGGSDGDGLTPTLEQLRDHLSQLDAGSTTVIFTGNYAGRELPEKDDPGREAAEAAVLAHVEATRAFASRGGKVYFLPGHHDFAAGGSKAVRRLRRFLGRAYRGGDEDEDEDVRDVMPEADCANATVVELAEGVSVLLLNSQWWMQQSDEDPNFGDSCLLKTRQAFVGELSEALIGRRHQRVLIAAHHPLASYGELGGAFTAHAHLEPAPVVGTAWVIARQLGLVPQHQNHPLVSSYVKTVADEALHYGTFVFASGHDASLQYVTAREQVQLVAGTSAKHAAPVVKAGEGDFARGAPGWAEVVIEADGAGEVRFVSNGQTLFTKALPPLNALPAAKGPPPATLPQAPVLASYSKRPVWRLPSALRFFVGSFYAEAFRLQLPYDVLDLEALGLEPYKIGGGKQSNSVRVHDRDGGDWAVRSTTKDTGRLLPFPLNRVSLATRGLEHGYTATQPEAALALPVLGDAASVLGVRPRMFYLPDQAALGPYRGFLGDEVVLLEQRPHALNEGLAPPAHLGGRDEKTKYEDYDALVEKLLEKPHKHRVDQEAMLRARLLDLFVGDWDRHRGQWRFAGNENEQGVKVYTPIAMDRDQAFSHYDGALLRVAQVMVPPTRALQPFDGHYGPLRWVNYSARDVDALMLNRLEHDRWMEIARAEQAALTDEVIDAALATWHAEAYALDGPRIRAALRQRRDGLTKIAEELYRRQARTVDVLGSMRDDRFELTFGEGGAVRVRVSHRKGDDAEPWFDRTFRPSETAELRLYALDGDDLLEVHGVPHEKIEIRFVGGEGKDVVMAESDRPLNAAAIHLYDRKRGARVERSIAVIDERSEVARLSQYEQYEDHDPDFGALIPGLYVNRDQGVYLGATYDHVVQGFKKQPFAARHHGSAYFATSTLGVALDYRGLFPQGFEVLDQQLDLTLHTPQYTRNFFGLTNHFHGDDRDPQFWRVRQARYEGRWGLAYGFGGVRSRVGAQLLAEGIVTERTAGRYVETEAGLSDDTFGARYFVGGRFFAETNTFDSLTLPRRGLALHTSVEARFDPVNRGGFSSNHQVAAAVAIPLDRAQRFVVLTRAVVEGIVGPHPFYFAPTLGEPQLRAYAQQQLAGDLAFAQTTDLRIDVWRIEAVLPSTLGVNLSADHGRVFGRGISGDEYHFNYGGGVWWSVADLFGVSLSYHRGLFGGDRFTASVGPLFANPGF